MAGEPERQKTEQEMEMPIRPKKTDQLDEPVDDGKGIKIYSFAIDELRKENTRYWFHAMRKQLELQYAWQAIEQFHAVGAVQHNE